MKKRNKDMFDRTWYNHYLRRKEYEKIKKCIKKLLIGSYHGNGCCFVV